METIKTVSEMFKFCETDCLNRIRNYTSIVLWWSPVSHAVEHLEASTSDYTLSLKLLEMFKEEKKSLGLEYALVLRFSNGDWSTREVSDGWSKIMTILYDNDEN